MPGRFQIPRGGGARASAPVPIDDSPRLERPKLPEPIDLGELPLQKPKMQCPPVEKLPDRDERYTARGHALNIEP